jgi:hypothetical protein
LETLIMLRSSVALALLFAGSAGAQSISYVTNNPSPIKGDPNQIVCEKADKIGTRLGGEKVCHTVAEWREIRDGVRENADRLQAGTRAACVPECGPDFSVGDLSGQPSRPPR